MWPVIALAALAGAGGALGVLYAGGAFERNPGVVAACRPALATAERIRPLARGELAALAVPSEPRRVPDLAFRDGEGRERRLSEWRGRTVLLNLWATWCAPCREEMPWLDQVQATLGGSGFEVVALNIDTRESARPREWLAGIGVRDLAFYADPTGRVFQDLRAVGRAAGMPTTLLIDPAGCELGYLPGYAKWASEDSLRLLRAAMP